MAPVVLVILLLAAAVIAVLIFLPRQSNQQEEMRQAQPGQQEEMRQAALRIEQTARRLSGRSSVPGDGDQQDVVSILESTNELLKALPKQEPQREPVVMQRPVEKTQKQEPSPIAKKIVALRDTMLLAKPKEGALLISAEVLDVFYQELGEILAQENVISLEEVGGRFNQERQRIIATKVTRDPAQHNIVTKSESPGYLFHERLLRPQEVVIYKFQDVA